MRTRLEKKILDVAEEDVDLTATMIGVTKPILMNLYLTSDALTIKSGPNEDVL